MKKYRISRYGYKSWQVEEWKLRSKKTGQWAWVPVKYPGRMTDAVRAAVDIGFEGFCAEDAQSIIDRLEHIAERLETALAASGDELVIEY